MLRVAVNSSRGHRSNNLPSRTEKWDNNSHISKGLFCANNEITIKRRVTLVYDPLPVIITLLNVHVLYRRCAPGARKTPFKEFSNADALILFILDPIWGKRSGRARTVFDKASARSQVVQTARKCLISPHAFKMCSSLPWRRLLTFQAAAPARRRRCREAPSSAWRWHTNTRRTNQIKGNRMQLAPQLPPRSCLSTVATSRRFDLSLVRFLSGVSSRSSFPSTSNSQSPSPPALRPRHVTLNYPSLPNKRIAVTKHCKLDRIMRRRRGIAGFCVATWWGNLRVRSLHSTVSGSV